MARDYQRQIIRFIDAGINLALPPELIPEGQYARLTNVLSNREGTLQGTAGTELAVQAIGVTPVHSMRRLADFVTDNSIFVIGAGAGLFQSAATYPGGGAAAATVALQADSTAIQIDVVSGAGTYTRLSGSFITNGFMPGHIILGSAFANGGNNVSKVVASVTALVITVTDNAGMVTETGGGNEQLRTVWSGNPLALVPFKLNFNSVTYMFIGDSTQNVKVSPTAVQTRMGIHAPGQTSSVAGGNAASAADDGAGNLLGDYDWRYTGYNTNRGTEGNPSAVRTALPLQQTFTNRAVNVTVTVSDLLADAQITHIRLYRRGGTLTDDWYRVSTTAIGAGPTQVIADDATDTSIASNFKLDASSGLTNDVPVASVDSTGATVYMNPLDRMWGPVDEVMFGIEKTAGDVGRPDAVYWSKKSKPESWPAANFVFISSPQDKCMNGFVYDNKSFVFTREKLYMLFPREDGTWLPLTTPAGHGIIGPWAFCIGPKIWFCSKDGIYETTGQEAVRISDGLRSLFPFEGSEGFTSNGYIPVNFGNANDDVLDIRMAFHNEEVWFFYRDTSNNFGNVFVYSTRSRAWRFEATVPLFTSAYSDEVPQSNLNLLGRDGAIHHKTGNDWNGTAVAAVVETGAFDQGLPRNEKQYGDLSIWATPAGQTINFSIFFDSAAAASITGTISGGGLIERVIDLASTYAKHIAVRFSWNSDDATGQPIIHRMELSYLPHPDTIIARETDWDELGWPADKWITGVIFEADPMGAAVTLQVQSEGGTVEATVITAADATDFPRDYHFTFAGFAARHVRLFPTSTTDWKFYGVKRWIFTPMPETITRYDTDEDDYGFGSFHFERDAYVELISNGTLTLTINVDGTALATQTIATAGGNHRKIYVPFPPNKGKVYSYSIVLGTATAFQLYDFVIRAKGWGDAEYREVRPKFRGQAA